MVNRRFIPRRDWSKNGRVDMREDSEAAVREWIIGLGQNPDRQMPCGCTVFALHHDGGCSVCGDDRLDGLYQPPYVEET